MMYLVSGKTKQSLVKLLVHSKDPGNGNSYIVMLLLFYYKIKTKFNKNIHSPYYLSDSFNSLAQNLDTVIISI